MTHTQITMVQITASATMPPITPPAIAPAELNINIRYTPLITLINECIVTKMKKKKVKRKPRK